MPPHKGEWCRVYGCHKPAALDVMFPSDLTDGRRALLEVEDRTRVCTEHGEQLGVVTGAFTVLEARRCAGWRLVVELVKARDANPIVLYPPGEEPQ